MIRIGKIVATRGLQGHVILRHIIGDSKWLKKGDALLLEMQKNSYVPYFIEDAKPVNAEEYQLHVEGVHTVEASKTLVTKQVYIEPSLIEKYAAKLPLLWIGYKLTDVHKGAIGTIDDVLQGSHQWLGKLQYDSKEVLIPLVSDFIRQINVKSKFIVVELPEGLLEVYTN